MLYQINNGTVSLGGNTILSHIDFSIKGKEKIAIVGPNGSGKTTLLKLIAGQLDLDRDDKRQGPGIIRSRDVSIEMMSQTLEGKLEYTINELLEKRCFKVDEIQYDKLLTGFGFDKSVKDKKLKEFSGGEQTKLNLIFYLLMKPDILLLDEPTNHLDIETCEWLEDYIAAYDRAVVFVSHDRFFLDQTVDTVYELSKGKLTKYSGNYSFYREQKSINLTRQLKEYESQQAEIKRLEDLIRKFKHKPNKAGFARSRKTMLERMERIEKPDMGECNMFSGQIIPQVLGSKWVLEASHLKIGYKEALLELSIRIRRGQKIGIIGPNGIGKSTFLKTVAGYLPPINGKLSLGNTILMGYFDQMTAQLESDKTVIDHFKDTFPAMSEKECRQTLGAYLFSGNQASKPVKSLSGGEKSRLVLCELLTSRPNFLVLDEPTNHMDVRAKEALEAAFKAYTGTLLFVSHDRYFISQLADALLVFGKEEVSYYPFGYQHYIERKKKGNPDDLIAMIAAEDQAMVADLKAVPKPEHHQLKEIGTETAHIDWRLRLMEEPMDQAEEKVSLICQEFPELKSLEDYENWKIELENAMEKWTQACLAWYDVRNELLQENL